MPEPIKRTKSPSARMSRSETVSVRLDPKLRYLAELAARKQRRSLSSYIEWAVEESLGNVMLYVDGNYGEHNASVSSESDRLWDVDESERFIKLAINYPELLTHEEQERWKMLSDSTLLQPAKSRRQNGSINWNHALLEDLIYPAVRKHWSSLIAAHAGGADAREAWVSNIAELMQDHAIYPSLANDGNDMDDIPF